MHNFLKQKTVSTLKWHEPKKFNLFLKENYLNMIQTQVKANINQLKRINKDPPKSEFGVHNTIRDTLVLRTHSHNYSLHSLLLLQIDFIVALHSHPLLLLLYFISYRFTKSGLRFLNFHSVLEALS